jgi:predicted aspartyl protease
LAAHYKTKDCFQASDWGYVIEARLTNPLRNLHFPEVGNTVFKVDTGFNGPIIVPEDVFEFLKLTDIEVPEDARPTYSTLTGPLTMRSAPGVFEANGKRLYTDILAPLAGRGRLLVGFRILNEFTLALLGDRACFIRPES